MIVVFGIALILLGVFWYRSDPVSAGRPGSLLVIVGLGFVGGAWWMS